MADIGMAAILFWVSLAFVAYTYAGYPVLIWLLVRLRPAAVEAAAPAADLPHVTVVMLVHNELQRLPRKLENLRSLDYPADRLQVLVVSDGSNDGSDEWLAAQPGITFIRYARRQGKAHALNVAMCHVRTPITVLTDARQAIAPSAVRFLVARLQQPGIGAVSGELVHYDPVSHDAAHIGLYWRYEKFIRKCESRLGCTVGATGALYALHTSAYVGLPSNALLDDFLVPMQIVRSGRRVVMEERAVLYDELQTRLGGELTRKTRTLAGNWQALALFPWLLSPRKNPVFAQLVSHKLFRLLVPYALLAMQATSLLASGPFYAMAAAAQLAFYGVALAAYTHPAMRANRVANLCCVFATLNLAAVLGLRSYLSGRLDGRWEKTS